MMNRTVLVIQNFTNLRNRNVNVSMTITIVRPIRNGVNELLHNLFLCWSDFPTNRRYNISKEESSWKNVRLEKGDHPNFSFLQIHIPLDIFIKIHYILFMKKTIIQKHISLIKNGDTVIHNGNEMTVNNHNIKSGFCGTTLFGDSYRMGTIPVQVVVFN